MSLIAYTGLNSSCLLVSLTTQSSASTCFQFRIPVRPASIPVRRAYPIYIALICNKMHGKNLVSH